MSNFLPLETPPPESTTLPFSREAEEAVIGAVLINPEAYYDVAQFLRGEDFYIHRNRWIWDTFTHLEETRTPIDLLTVTEILEQSNHLSEIGGPAYLTTLINQVPSSLHAEAYGRIIQETAIRRRMLLSANEIANLAYDTEKPLQNIIDQAEQSAVPEGGSARGREAADESQEDSWQDHMEPITSQLILLWFLMISGSDNNILEGF